MVRRIVAALCAIWLGAWIVLAWGANQDDAFIHLRYADFLHRLGFITYDGIHRSYGTSSLLYVALLASLRGFTTSPLLPHAVSAFFHGLLFLLTGAWLLGARVKDRASASVLGCCTLILLVTPSAVRWLEDGMETSLVLGLVALAAWLTFQQSLSTSVSLDAWLAGLLLGFLLVLLRTELVLVSGFACAILIAADAGPLDRRWIKRAWKAIPIRCHFLAGALLAAATIRVLMGSLLPDTALAKSDGISFFFATLSSSAQVIAGALLFGVGTLLAWIVSAWFVSAAILMRRSTARLFPTLIANALFPVLSLLAALRGQKIQGVRYLIWAIFFSLCWNILELSRSAGSAHKVTLPKQAAPYRMAGILGVAGCILLISLDARLSWRTIHTRVQTFQLIQAQNLAVAMPHALGVGGDVGYISYFSHDQVCDLAGLINGRAAAALTAEQRLERCAASHPSFAFVNNTQAAALATHLDLSSWQVCGQYDFGNTGDPDRHYLLVRPEEVSAVCAATHSTPQPSAEAFRVTHYASQ